MNDFAKTLSKEAAIARWENEGGAVKPLPEVKANNQAILICIGCAVVLPLFYWLMKR